MSSQINSPLPSNFWQGPDGLQIINKGITKWIPAWSDGLRGFQKQAIGTVLNLGDFLGITATGNGKSAAFFVPLMVHDEILKNPELCPRFKPKSHAVGIVVTPTKGLASNIVCYCFILNFISS